MRAAEAWADDDRIRQEEESDAACWHWWQEVLRADPAYLEWLQSINSRTSETTT